MAKVNRAEAKEMNEKYDGFYIEFYDESIERKMYHYFGRAYEAANIYIGKGMSCALYGFRENPDFDWAEFRERFDYLDEVEPFINEQLYAC